MGRFIKPSELKAVLPNPTDTLCVQFKNFITFTDLVYQIQSWMFDEGGGLSTDFQALLCQLPCAGGTGGGTGSTTGSPGSTGSTTTTTPQNNGQVPSQLGVVQGSHGFYTEIGWFNHILWSKTNDATMYQVKRGTVDDINDASVITLFGSPRTPDPVGTTNPVFPYLFDNIDHIVFVDKPTSFSTIYYYWVIPYNSNAAGVPSNSAYSYGGPRTPYNAVSAVELDTNGQTTTVPGGVSKARLVLKAGGAGGAGGSATLGGGGGGGGSTYIIANVGVSPGDTIELVYDPNSNSTGNANAATNGVDGFDAVVKINGSEIARAFAGHGGRYSASQAGTGGQGGVAGTGGSDPNVEYWNGFGGRDANGTKGGEGGVRWGGFRRLPAHLTSFNTQLDPFGDASDIGCGGGGSCGTNDPNITPLAVGGKGQNGNVIIQYSA